MWEHNEIINEAKMLEKIRKLLGLTIEDFVYQMNWPNVKYYDYIKNGRKRPGETDKKITHPTIYKVFTGINKAISQHNNWKENSSEITAIVISYLMPKA
ncbi:hypothetical protein [Candidatus Mycoplasma mahonii]|uniref:hypothetical protein n=1 Tax=Candidatus Mycoplasma mahonii TaxID=3004105 RepID=UPI0026EEE5D4|nr:hypothetical protein [Candidatus Mycoplasma mahonii]WKX02261.1 hypothetical protein O3I44_02555 [Candidatus Mycoplasma mahonii]